METLQVCGYKKMEEMELPTLKNGEVVNDLGKYMTELGNFKKHLGYHNPDTSIDKMKLQFLVVMVVLDLFRMFLVNVK
jgi:hypothetical protein